MSTKKLPFKLSPELHAERIQFVAHTLLYMKRAITGEDTKPLGKTIAEEAEAIVNALEAGHRP